MKLPALPRLALLALTLGLAACGGGTPAGEPVVPKAGPASGLQPAVPNGEGASATVTTAASGAIDTKSPFFLPFGNGRACASCHQPEDGWSIRPETLMARFEASDGLDPVFRTVDGSVSPNAPVATRQERAAAYALLLEKGLIRVGLPVPADAEFELAEVRDPYGFASAAELSLFRRPLPTTNLAFQTAVMWDGRETPRDPSPSATLCVRGLPGGCFISLDDSLLRQADSAIRGHAQATLGAEPQALRAIVDFERTLFTAQTVDLVAGSLTEDGARGGPVALSTTPFRFGINDVAAGDYATGAPFDPRAMRLFEAWLPAPGTASPNDPKAAARAAIARGEQLFNGRRFAISGVRGFNDELGRPVVQGTCTSCHATPDVGTHPVPRLMATGVSAASRHTPDLPLYTLRNRTTGETLSLSDPGAALVTGRWADVGKMKVPSLRGLESRSPYFHNGSENDLVRLVGFYDTRFGIGFTEAEVADLVAFLKAL